MTSIEFTLSMNHEQHCSLKSLMFPGDNREHVCVLLCSRRAGPLRHRLIVKEIYPISPKWYRNHDGHSVTWSTDALEDALEIAEKHRLSVIKIHCHPNGYPNFSAIDDTSDQRFLPAIRDWFDMDFPHGSAVMLPDGQLFGRVLNDNEIMQPMKMISVVGDELKFWVADAPDAKIGDFTASHAQAFGQGTTEVLRQLTIAIVGCSGTGSPVAMQLARLGVKKLILVDDDIVEERNINRILYTSRDHVNVGTPKVEALAEGIRRIGIDTDVVSINRNLVHRDAVKAVASADVVFGCMDSIEGRYILNRLATFYTLPYFDIGVRLQADGQQGISEICGTINYLQPGGSSLMSRGLFSLNDVKSDGLRRRDPIAYEQQVQDGYIRGAIEHRPAVISLNMFAASLAVFELLSRIHPFRDEPNSEFASVGFSLASSEFFLDPDGCSCQLLQKYVGYGDVDPILELLEFA